MKKYEAYKNSGLNWISEIPIGWKTNRIKYLFSFGRGLNITKSNLTETGVPVISYGQIHAKFNTGTAISDSLLRFIPEELTIGNEACRVTKGDFIFADTSEDKEGCGNCVYIDREGVYAGYHSMVLKRKDPDNKYYAYLFKSDDWRSQIRAKVSGVKVYSITQSILSECTVLIPSKTEQQAIVDYLDYKVGLIDKSISAINTEIENLKDYRQSLISETVTKGLNSNAKMKDSGIEWIGEIPESWKCLKIKWIINLKSGLTLNSEQISETGNYLVFGGNGPRGYYDKFNNEGYYVLIGRQGALCGNINYAKGKFWATEHALVCYPRTTMEVFWLGETLRAANLNQYSMSAAQPGLSVERIGELCIPFPPLSEQKTIADYLDNKTRKIDEAIARLEQVKELQTQYKQSLISEAVTGKIDVRDWIVKKQD